MTRPVTHTDVVAVKRASMGEVAAPDAEEQGSARKKVPSRIAHKKPIAMIWVVDKCSRNGFMAILDSILLIYLLSFDAVILFTSVHLWKIE